MTGLLAKMEYADILERASSDAGYCQTCHKHLDSGLCECTDEEREDGDQGCTCPVGSDFCTC